MQKSSSSQSEKNEMETPIEDEKVVHRSPSRYRRVEAKAIYRKNDTFRENEAAGQKSLDKEVFGPKKAPKGEIRSAYENDIAAVI